MAGITSVGAYIPRYRLSLEEIAGFWGGRSGGGERAVAGFDEDSITMAVAAGLECLAMRGEADGLYFAGNSSPYKEKQGAAIIAGALDLNKESRTADFTGSLRSGSTAIRAALDAVNSGSAQNILVTAADCRPAAPQGKLEQLFGDAAAAVAIGSDPVIAEIEESYSIFCDFTDFWRKEQDAFIQSAEGRFTYAEGYLPAVQEAVSGLLKRCSAKAGDFSKIVYYALDRKEHAGLAKKLGFEKSQVQDPLFSRIGNAGTAAALLMLIAALENAKPGDRILYVSYGDGCDALALRATGALKPGQESLKVKLERRTGISYSKYLAWRDLIPIEASTLPQRPEPSITTRWRERRGISALYGAKCRKCGTPQIHPLGQSIRICVSCQAKDDFDPYKFSDKPAKLFSYAIDQLQPSKNPPGLNGVVDFEGGGRLICELTDCDPEEVRIGMPVKMTFRKMYQGSGIINYFWKAQPK